MPSKAAEFFNSIVKPTVDEFLANARDVRRGRIAAIILYHMADHQALDGYVGQDRKEMKERLDSLLEKLLAKFPEFSLIRDIADATKHAQLSVQKKAARQLTSSEQITASPGIFQAPFGEGVFAEASEVFATLDNGDCKPLEPAIRSTLEMWEKELNAASGH